MQRIKEGKKDILMTSREQKRSSIAEMRKRYSANNYQNITYISFLRYFFQRIF